MSIKRFFIPLAAVALLLTAGCRSQRDAARTQPATPVDSGTGMTVSPRYYTTNFTCSAQGMTATGQIRMAADSIIWLSASKVIELGRVRFTPDSAIIYAKVMGRCFRGTYDDLYRRFHYRTSFKDISETVTSDDAPELLSSLARQFGIAATFTLEPWKRVDQLTFPFAVPDNVNPL
ncbi:MAG: DUF4292 domain-containing protein [Bacteroidales bacterium]|nr:DUF4292 domain-containing protein [Bacteroidales bacterium]